MLLSSFAAMPKSFPLENDPFWYRDAVIYEVHVRAFFDSSGDGMGDFGGLTATELYRRNFLGCFITDRSALQVAERIGVDTLAWECDYPHADSTWPNSPELLMEELKSAPLSDDVIDKITWQNACRFFRFDPFAHRPREESTVAALRKLNPELDTSETSRHEYRRRYEARVAV